MSRFYDREPPWHILFYSYGVVGLVAIVLAAFSPTPQWVRMTASLPIFLFLLWLGRWAQKRRGDK